MILSFSFEYKPLCFANVKVIRFARSIPVFQVPRLPPHYFQYWYTKLYTTDKVTGGVCYAGNNRNQDYKDFRLGFCHLPILSICGIFFYFLANIFSWHDIINIKGFTLAERSVFYSYINPLDMFSTITTICSILLHYIASLINNTLWWRSPSTTIYSTLCLRLNKSECESSNLYSDITFPPLIPLILGNKTSIKGEILHSWQPPLPSGQAVITSTPTNN